MTLRSMFLPDPIADYIRSVGVREPAALARLRAETAALPQAHYQIAPEEGQLLGFLVGLLGARRILDIGTFTGYSALVMAMAGGPEARIVSLDVSDDFTEIARRHWRSAGLDDRIELRLGPALETLAAIAAEPGAAGSWDLAFVDADKENYARYYEISLGLVRPGGLVIADNTLWRGRVVDPSNRKAKTEAFRAFNTGVHADPRVDIVVLPVGDGVTLARKRQESSAP